MDRSSPRTWKGDSDLPYPGGRDSGLPFLDGLDLVHPCLDVRDSVPLVPCLDSVLPCPDVMMVPWGCFLGAKKGPLEHFHSMVFPGLSRVDYLILVLLGLSFQRRKL